MDLEPLKYLNCHKERVFLNSAATGSCSKSVMIRALENEEQVVTSTDHSLTHPASTQKKTPIRTKQSSFT